MIKGNSLGIRKVYIDELNELINKQYDKNKLIDEEVMNTVCSISGKIGKEVSLYINRHGVILDITIGDDKTVLLKGMNEKRSEYGLCGIRCIHTHPNCSSCLSSLDKTALANLKFDLLAAIGVIDEKPAEISIGYIKADNGGLTDDIVIDGPIDASKVIDYNFMNVVENIEKTIFDYIYENEDKQNERTILVGSLRNDMYSAEESLYELEELVTTAGGNVVEKVMQNKNKVDAAYYIGRGKAEEISHLVQNISADTVVFDDELSGIQQRNLEEIFNCKVIDRTTLILDIFAQRAKSSEGKIQVELAQLKYRFPRLIGMGGDMSRTGGGIGTRGPGEKKLETDKRIIKKRIYDLEEELKNIKKTRELQRERRISNEIPVVTLAGYTNAGKSTLRNKMCENWGTDKEKVFESDILFATLDPTTRLVSLPSGKEALLTDTVGFIRKLPHELVEAFKSTLEEVALSDLIVHVVDGSNKNAIAQMETVNSVLNEIGAGDKKLIIAVNKIDKAPAENIDIIRSKFNNIIEISALNGYNIDELLKAIDSELFGNFITEELLVPYEKGNILSYLHDNNCVEKEEYRENGIYIRIKTTPDIIGRVSQYKIDK